MAGLDLIKVTSGLPVAADGGSRVALSEKHPHHPGGEVFVAGAGVFVVARTPAVEGKLTAGELVLAEQPAAQPDPEPAPELAGEGEGEGDQAPDEPQPQHGRGRGRRG